MTHLFPYLFMTFFGRTIALCPIVFILLFFIPCQAFAQGKTATSPDKTQIGQVVIAIGKVKAKGADQSERTLKRGDPFYLLDTIVVEAASRSELKFVDGAIVSLIASTEYRIESYAAQTATRDASSVATLIKGGFRAISGAIAKENPSGTSVKSLVATIGLRGTVYEAVLVNDRLSVGCEDGKAVVSNEKGSVEIGPSSNTLYAIAQKGKAPIASKEIPPDLATAFGAPGRVTPPSSARTPSYPGVEETEQQRRRAAAPPLPGQSVSGQPIPGQPFPTQGAPGQAFPGQAGPGQPAGGQPGFGQPGYGQPATGQPGQPGPGQPLSRQFSPIRPVSGQPGPERAFAPNEEFGAPPYEPIEGEAYQASFSTSRLVPLIAIGTVAIVGTVLFISQSHPFKTTPFCSSGSGSSRRGDSPSPRRAARAFYMPKKNSSAFAHH
jgi:hypothetical protein